MPRSDGGSAGGCTIARSLIGYTPEAARQVRDLKDHYRLRQRPEALKGLVLSLAAAGRRILDDPVAGLTAPRPYPGLSKPGRRWVKEGRYWIVYNLSVPPVIVAVFYEEADIPGRLR